jgi:hypothetical protein
LSLDEAAEYCGVSPNTMARHGPAGAKIGGRTIFDRRVLDRWLDKLGGLRTAFGSAISDTRRTHSSTRSMLEKLRYVTRRVDRSGRERLYWQRRGHPLSPLSAEELTAAEERMWELGFAVEADGNVIAWKYRQEPFVVLADPRVRRRLRFCVYDEERLAAASVAAAVSRLLPPSERVRLPQSSTCSTIGDRTSSANFSRVCRRRLQVISGRALFSRPIMRCTRLFAARCKRRLRVCSVR